MADDASLQRSDFPTIPRAPTELILFGLTMPPNTIKSRDVMIDAELHAAPMMLPSVAKIGRLIDGQYFEYTSARLSLCAAYA